jgi:hypothetical protein
LHGRDTDCRPSGYEYSLKIFTAFYTAYNHSGQAFEWSLFTQRRRSASRWAGLPRVSSFFEVESWHGAHYCLVCDIVEAEDLATFQHHTLPDRTLPLETAKVFAQRVLRGLSILHDAGSIFAALRPNTVFTATVGIYLSAQLAEPIVTRGVVQLPSGPVSITASQPLRSSRSDPGSLGPLKGVFADEVHLNDFSFSMFR